MTRRAPHEALRDAARRDPPPGLSDADARAMIDRALVAAATPERAADEHRATRDAATDERLRVPMRPRWPWVAAVAAAALVATAGALSVPSALWVPSGRPRVVTPIKRAPEVEAIAAREPTELQLSSGDVVVATEDARYEVLPSGDGREVTLHHGGILCDVRSVPGSTFRVRTRHATIEVLGTVFGVSVREGGTAVWVYEGRVEVRGGRDVRVLEVGEAFASDGSLRADPLREVGRARAAARAEPGPRRARRRPERRASVSSPPPLDLQGARALVAAGEAERARERATEVLREEDDAEWRVLRATAHQALGRPDRALADLERAFTIAPSRRAELGYRIAQLRWRAEADPEGALEALERGRVTAPGSPFAERGLSLSIDALRRLGRHREARRARAEYLRRYPSTSRAEQLRPTRR